MATFNPDNYDNAINLYRLSASEQKEIMNEIEDSRLSNPPGDYFQLELSDETIEIPKVENVSIKTEDGKIKSLPVETFIRKKLEAED